jgi:HK97 family phage prohead protease
MMQRIVVPFEIKAVGDRELEGYGSTFGNVDLGGDVVVKGAFSRSLKKHKAEGTKPKMLWNHKLSDLPIGVWEEFEEDDHGLYVRGKFADTQMGNDVRTLAKMRAIDSMSIGYIPVDADYTKGGERLLKEVDLWEVSLVNTPMNPAAVIAGVKSMFPDSRSLEHYLRDAGCSRTAAKTIVSEVINGKSSEMLEESLRDAGDDVLYAAEKALNSIVAGMIRPISR